MRLTFSHGVYLGGLPARAGAERGRLTVDGRTGEWPTFRRRPDEPNELPYVAVFQFPRLSRSQLPEGWTRLEVRAECRTEPECGKAWRVVGGIRFPDTPG